MSKHELIDLRDAVREGKASLADFMDTMADRSQCAMLAYYAYCGGLDAAKQMHEAVLPGWGWTLDWDDEAEIYGQPVWDRQKGAWVPGASFFSGRCDKENPARAWLLAILEVLIEGGGDDQ